MLQTCDCINVSFLKTFLYGCPLTDIETDENNQMFPIAWAIAEEEDDSREWFLQLVQKAHMDLGR